MPGNAEFKCTRPDGKCPAFGIEIKIELADNEAAIHSSNLEADNKNPYMSQFLRNSELANLRSQIDSATRLENELSALRTSGELCENCNWRAQ